jgi:hypothetical protein
MVHSNAATSVVALCGQTASECSTLAATIDCAPPALLQPRVERLTSLQQLAESADAWRDLCDQSGGAIEQFEWIQACLDTHRMDPGLS